MEFYGVLGEKLGHSLSPRIHKMIFEIVGIEGAYKLFEVPRSNLNLFADSMKVLGIKGANVTIPYKEEIMQYIDVISPEAQAIGAVNTIVLREEKLWGFNTDYYGFGYLLHRYNIDLKEKRVVILGFGGAAKSILQYLLDSKAKSIYVVSRSNDKTIKSKDNRVKLITYEELKTIEGDILINTTPVGMFPKDEACPVEEGVIEKFSTVIDTIYNPGKTQLLSKAEGLNKQVIGGLYMLIGQGVRAQELWHDISIDESVIKDIYEILNREFS